MLKRCNIFPIVHIQRLGTLRRCRCRDPTTAQDAAPVRRGLGCCRASIAQRVAGRPGPSRWLGGPPTGQWTVDERQNGAESTWAMFVAHTSTFLSPGPLLTRSRLASSLVWRFGRALWPPRTLLILLSSLSFCGLGPKLGASILPASDQRPATSDSRASQSSSRLLNARHDDVTPFAANSHDDHPPRPPATTTTTRIPPPPRPPYPAPSHRWSMRRRPRRRTDRPRLSWWEPRGRELPRRQGQTERRSVE